MPDTSEPSEEQPPEGQGPATPYHIPDQLMPPARKRHYLWLLLAVPIVAAMAYGGWKLYASKKATTAKTQSSKVQPQTSPTVAQDVPDSSSKQTYENNNLRVKLSYPANWTVAESATKDGVRLESPTFIYQAIAKGQVSGNFRLYIRLVARDIDGKYIGRGVAIQPSQKLTYAQPAVGQRADTNVSLFGLDTPDNFAFFLVAGNFQLNKGDTLGPAYGREQGTFIIAGGYSSKDLTDDLATNPVSPSSLQTSNAYKQALEILKSIQLL